MVDLRNGLYVLRYRGPHVAEVACTGFLEGNSNLAARFPGCGVRISRGRVTATGDGHARLRVYCRASDPEGCRGRLTLATRRATKLGSRSFAIAPGKARRVDVKLSEAGRRALERLGALRIEATARVLGRDRAASSFLLRAPRS